MSTVPAHAGRERAQFGQAADVDLFLANLRKFEAGELSAEAWRAFRLVNGTYGQRQEGDLSMLRAKIPQGVLSARALRAVADVAERYGRGFAHLTTRQNFQFHFVKLAEVEPAMRVLLEAGVTTREACGNSVRNVTACPLAGVAADEVFDVTPYAEAVTRHLLRHPLSSSLPRKFKIAFEGCPEDHAFASIHDLGFRARVRGDAGRAVRGFRVLAGGGTATVPTSARVLADFLPAGELLALVEAVVAVFHRLGDRQNRHANRMKFLIRKIGWEAFRTEVERELGALRARGAPALPFAPDAAPVEAAPAWARPAAPPAARLTELVRRTPVRGPGILPVIDPGDAGEAAFAAWRATNVRPQRQAGFAAVTVTLPLGDLTSGQLRALADLAAAHGDGTARATLGQDLLLRWVPEAEVPALYRGLAAAGLARDGAGTVADVVSCPGAESCKLAVTASRGVGRLVEEHLRAHPEVAALAPDLTIKVSGCPNGCSQHHVAGIGLQGSARKLDGRALPQYFVLLGGGSTEEGARFGRLAAKIPARRVPQAVERLLRLYAAEKAAGERPADFLARLPLERAKALLQDLAEITAAEATAEDWIDPGEAAAFKPETGEGECAA